MKTRKDNVKTKERLQAYARFENRFLALENFIEKHPSLSSMEFEHYSTHELTLFSVEPNLDFNALALIYKRINAALPAIKRIFAKPIINLTDADEVLPVELVHIINQDTLHHLASHSESLEDITPRGVKPRELLTRVYQDDYGIYENLVFCNLIDSILSFSHSTLLSLRNLIYAKEVLEFNLLERANHLNYFLTIGKLHTGYIRDFDKYYATSKELYSHFGDLINVLQSRLHKNIYAKNKDRNKKLPLKKTNIFLMQKDYHQIYVLAKWLANENILLEEKEEIDEGKLQKEYFHFINTLALFALTNFNFDAEEGSSFNLAHLNNHFRFGPWSFTLENVEERGLLLKAHKDKDYTILLLPLLDIRSKNSPCKAQSDEVLVTTPFEEDSFYNGIVYLSIESIDSFRRLQQLFLKAMVYSDTTRDVCPFCGGKLKLDEENDSYQCDTCRTLIKKGVCEETGNPFFYTTIARTKKPSKTSSILFSRDDPWLFHRQVEASMYFRNITRINEKGEILCPFCGKVH